MKSVLVTAIGSLSADIVIKKLKDNNFFIVGCDIYAKELVVDSNNVDVFYQVPKVFDEKNYKETILKICEEHKINYIFPLTDVEVDFYNNNRNFFTNQIICISDVNTINLCRDKYKFQQFIKGLDYINGIDTDYIHDVNANEISFPVVCKIINGRSSENLIYIYDKNKFLSFSKNVDNNYIVEPYIDGNIITVDVVRDRKCNVVSIPREELLRTSNGLGLSVYIFKDENLENICEKLANDLNIIGCVNFEFIKNNDKYYILECNPRFSGGIEFSCLAGYDFVINHIKSFETTIEKKKTYNNQYIARKYEEYVMKIDD